MAKHYKIKRYDRIYRRSHKPRISPVKALLILASAGILFFLGWSLYQPVYDLLTGIPSRWCISACFRWRCMD